jgi:hypothetical protein
MRKIFLVIFFLLVLPNLSLADNWEPILKIRPIIEKDIDLLDKIMDINLAKKKEVFNLTNKLSYELVELNKLDYEYTVLVCLHSNLMIVNEDLFAIKTLLLYNKNLKGSKIFKERLNFIINTALDLIEKAESDEKELIKKGVPISYETIEVLDNIKSDLKKALKILESL